ncbi:hypothetical protein AB1286_16115 [Trinickia sp. NRRL B-1857]|uniref:hypothetical protein n=1 Tax=Trinickia sp. NRRL B-1857 TaxID=3162879 RepID=UPI003D298052
MIKSSFGVATMLASCVGWAMPPSENLIRSCLRAQSIVQAVTIQNIDVSEVYQEDGYADGFNASYFFKHNGVDIGYAERKLDRALIYREKLYGLYESVPIGDNRGYKPADFSPALAQWSLAKDGSQQYLCVSFNFDGVGRSGSFQSVVGGYILNEQTKSLYFVVRDTEK